MLSKFSIKDPSDGSGSHLSNTPLIFEMASQIGSVLSDRGSRRNSSAISSWCAKGRQEVESGSSVQEFLSKASGRMFRAELLDRLLRRLLNREL